MKALVLTGGSRGIGHATAARFLAAGWKVYNLSRQPCSLPLVQNFHVDLTQPDWEIPELGAALEVLPALGRLCIIHAAATHDAAALPDVKLAHLRRDFEISIASPVRLNQLLLPRMKAGSSIFYLGSTLSEKAVAGVLSYVIQKHALVGLMRASCQDLSTRQIHTACICPGFTDTEMLRDHLHHDPELLDVVKSRVGYHRLIEPREIAELLYFCAENPVINGAVLHANLGQVER